MKFTSLLEFYTVEVIDDVIFSEAPWCFQVVEDGVNSFVEMMDSLKNVVGNVFPPLTT
jgi:hypothetical protein